MSEQSSSFPVFNRRPPVQSAEEIEDPLHVADRESEELEQEVADGHLGPLAPVPPGTAYVLLPGEGVQQFPASAHLHGPRIVFDASGLTIVEAGGRSHDCTVAKKLLWVAIERRPVGYLSRGNHFVVALDRAGETIARLDTSDSWTMQPDCIQQLCALAGIGFEAVTVADVEGLLKSHPELVPPKLEFEAHHSQQETAREWALFITDVFIGVALFGGAVSVFYVTPVGIAVRAAIGLAVIVFAVLTLWARSRQRMQRSLRSRANTAVKTRSGSGHPLAVPPIPMYDDRPRPIVHLEKVNETDTSVSYDAVASTGVRLRVLVDKADGTVTVDPERSDPAANTPFIIIRATRVLRACWQSGDYPATADYRA